MRAGRAPQPPRKSRRTRHCPSPKLPTAPLVSGTRLVPESTRLARHTRAVHALPGTAWEPSAPTHTSTRTPCKRIASHGRACLGCRPSRGEGGGQGERAAAITHATFFSWGRVGGLHLWEGHSLRVPLVVQAQQGWRCTSPPPTTRAPPRPTASPPDRLPARSPLPLQLCSPALHPRSTGSPALTPPRASRCLAARS